MNDTIQTLNQITGEVGGRRDTYGLGFRLTLIDRLAVAQATAAVIEARDLDGDLLDAALDEVDELAELARGHKVTADEIASWVRSHPMAVAA